MSSPLSTYFKGIGAKRLRDVEVKPKKSNQHEINGSKALKSIFGEDKLKFKGRFIYINDNEDEILETSGLLSWYDSRKNVTTRAAEYRLYYTTNEVISSADTGDLLIIGLTPDNELIVIVAQKGSTVEKQLLWLFGFEELNEQFLIRDVTEERSDLGFAGKYILTSLGIEIEETVPDYLNELLRKYKKKFPTTSIFSEFARSTVKDVSVIEAPDEALMKWLEREELLFRTLEAQIVKERLKQGFGQDGTDVDEFISFSLSVQNRRKSRAGHSLENHLGVIFNQNKIYFSKGAATERNNKPDFLFPSQAHYNKPFFDVELLTMLGSKTTAKDRWRQVLSEADKIKSKHLITLEPSISKNQTDEMRAQSLQLIIPKPIWNTYQPAQQSELLSLSDFIQLLNKKQSQIFQ